MASYNGGYGSGSQGGRWHGNGRGRGVNRGHRKWGQQDRHGWDEDRSKDSADWRGYSEWKGRKYDNQGSGGGRGQRRDWQGDEDGRSHQGHRWRGRGRRGRGRRGGGGFEPGGYSDENPQWSRKGGYKGTERSRAKHAKYQTDEEHSDGASNTRGHHRPPAGLKGREIGMWYAARSKRKQGDLERETRQFVQMDKSKEENLSKLLKTIRRVDDIAPQPEQSYQDIDQDGTYTAHDYWSDDEVSDTTGYSTSCMSNEKQSTSRKMEGAHSNNVPSSSTRTGVTNETNVSDDFLPLSISDMKHNKISSSTRGQSSKRPRSKEQAYTQSSTVYGRSNSGPQEPGSSKGGGLSSLDSKQETNISLDDKFKVPQGLPVKTRLAVMDTMINSDDDEDDDDDDDDSVLSDASGSAASDDMSTEDDGDDDIDDETLLASLYQYEQAEEDSSSFISEYKSHKMANSRSQERLNEESRPVLLGAHRDQALDERLQTELAKKHDTNTKYKQMLKFRKKLPSYQMREKIIDVINRNQVTVISGETGCGKTTQVAQFILDDYIQRGDGSACHICCTQPRRISAISVAERVADERGEPCGEGSSVGYQIRLDCKLPRKKGSILYCTTGIMLKWLVSDPWLSRTSHVILDEIHERDLQSDFLMIVLKDVIMQRPDLKIVLMSATLNAELFSQYYGNCPMLHIPGFTFPVQEFLLEDTVEMLRYCHGNPSEAGNNRRPRRLRGKEGRQQMLELSNYHQWCDSQRDRYSHQTIDVLKLIDTGAVDVNLIVALIRHICLHKQDGAILVFLPGWDDISKVHEALQRERFYNPSQYRLIPLHSLMPTVNQREVFERPQAGIRKIVLATNIAETSITIDDVVYVIDCGKIKMKNFDAEHNIATLKPEPVSRANARQRRGRAGRVQPGECYHLYSAYHEAQFEDYQLPEMLRTRLEELCLQIKLLQLGRIAPFVSKALQPPSMDALQCAIDTLQQLEALDVNEDLTPLGFHLARLPVDPHTGKMLLFAAMFCCVDPVLTIAASLSFKDAFYTPIDKAKQADQRKKILARDTHSDHIMLANAFKGWERAKSRGTDRQYCYDNFLSQSTLKMLANMRRQFTELLHDTGFLHNKDLKATEANINSDNIKLVKAVICAGLYPNVAKIKPRKITAKPKPLGLMTKTEHKVAVHPKSVNETSDVRAGWVIYHLKMKTAKIYLYDTTVISPYPLLLFGGNITARKDNGEDCIVIDGWILFRASRSIARIVQELRKELDSLLEYKITHPGLTNWDTNTKEGALMTAIRDLITTEQQHVPSHR